MTSCDAELCPYWGGDDCLCDLFGIEAPGPDADSTRLPSATYEVWRYRTEES